MCRGNIDTVYRKDAFIWGLRTNTLLWGHRFFIELSPMMFSYLQVRRGMIYSKKAMYVFKKRILDSNDPVFIQEWQSVLKRGIIEKVLIMNRGTDNRHFFMFK
jgi:hypothetical protein